jgi:hypothetical protein
MTTTFLQWHRPTATLPDDETLVIGGRIESRHLVGGRSN